VLVSLHRFSMLAPFPAFSMVFLAYRARCVNFNQRICRLVFCSEWFGWHVSSILPLGGIVIACLALVARWLLPGCSAIAQEIVLTFDFGDRGLMALLFSQASHQVAFQHFGGIHGEFWGYCMKSVHTFHGYPWFFWCGFSNVGMPISFYPHLSIFRSKSSFPLTKMGPPGPSVSIVSLEFSLATRCPLTRSLCVGSL